MLIKKEIDAVNRTLDSVIDSGDIYGHEGGAQDSTFLKGGKTRWAHANLLELPSEYSEPIKKLRRSSTG